MSSRRLLPPLIAFAALLLAPAAHAVTVRSGHLDFGARLVGGHLKAQVKDGTGPRVVWRDPAGVTVLLGAGSRTALPDGLASVGRTGTRVWMIPQVQRAGVPWLGWNTEELTTRQLRGPVTWSLVGFSGPGQMAVFQTGSFGDIDLLLASGGPRSMTIPLGVHAHGNWVFTRPGTYQARFRMSATARNGRALSDAGNLRFVVKG